MRIDRVESLPLGGAHFLRIHTDTGLVGFSQSGCWGYPEAVHAMMVRFADYLVGQDPLRIEHHWNHLYRMGPFRGSVLSAALSAVDIALWDIKGQHLQAPIWDLLGGSCRDRVRLFLLIDGADADQLAQAARAALDKGFTALKFDPIPPGSSDMSLPRLIGEITDRIAAVQAVSGRQIDTIIELHRRLTPLTAMPVIEAIGALNPLFVEDPIQIDSIASQAEFARRFNVPIANGERLHTIWEFKELLAAGGAQYVRPDLGLAGGFSQCRKIAALAESYHAAVVTHNFLGPVLTAASLHLDIAIPNVTLQEYSLFDEGPVAKAFDTALVRDGGYLLRPECVGLGVRLKDETIAPLTPLPGPLHKIPMRADGSVAYAV